MDRLGRRGEELTDCYDEGNEHEGDPGDVVVVLLTFEVFGLGGLNVLGVQVAWLFRLLLRGHNKIIINQSLFAFCLFSIRLAK
jgi:hypothetical protein